METKFVECKLKNRLGATAIFLESEIKVLITLISNNPVYLKGFMDCGDLLDKLVYLSPTDQQRAIRLAIHTLSQGVKRKQEQWVIEQIQFLNKHLENLLSFKNGEDIGYPTSAIGINEVEESEYVEPATVDELKNEQIINTFCLKYSNYRSKCFIPTYIAKKKLTKNEYRKVADQYFTKYWEFVTSHPAYLLINSARLNKYKDIYYIAERKRYMNRFRVWVSSHREECEKAYASVKQENNNAE